MMNAKRLFSMLALLLALVMLFSVLYIALEAEHDCCGECCVICARIQACEKLLGDLLPATALLLAVRLLGAPIRVFADAEGLSAHPHTLIALKVKLSN